MAYYETGAVFGLGFISFLFFYLSISMKDDKWKVIQTLFMFAGLFFVVMTATLVLNLAVVETAGTTVTGVLNQSVVVATYIMYVAMAYFMIQLLITVLNLLRNSVKK